LPYPVYSMQISLSNAGKRFNREWIFRHFSHDFLPGNSYAITGPNGSGKSTLLQVIAGALTFSEGTISYAAAGGNSIAADQAYRHISIAAPYLELIEEFSAAEMLDFHARFKDLVLPKNEILSLVGLETAAGKQIRYFSSGMKQRLKLAQAFFSKGSVLLLDEPTTNLDADGIALYQQLIQDHSSGRLVIVSSNDKEEYAFCREVIAVGQYKTQE